MITLYDFYKIYGFIPRPIQCNHQWPPCKTRPEPPCGCGKGQWKPGSTHLDYYKAHSIGDRYTENELKKTYNLDNNGYRKEND